LLDILLDSWYALVVALNNLAHFNVLYTNMVKESLFNEETRKKMLELCFQIEGSCDRK